MSSKVPCDECGTLILQRTARRNGGLCAPCITGTRESIERSKERYRRTQDLEKTQSKRTRTVFGDSRSEFWESVRVLGYCLLLLGISFVSLQFINGVRDATGFPYELESDQLQDRKWASEEKIYALLRPLAVGNPELAAEIEKTAILKQEAKVAHGEAQSEKPAPGTVIGRRRGGQFFPNKKYEDYIDANRRAMGREGAVDRHTRWTANHYYPLLEDTENAEVAESYSNILQENEQMGIRWEEYTESPERRTHIATIGIGIFLGLICFISLFATPFLLLGVLFSLGDKGRDDHQTL